MRKKVGPSLYFASDKVIFDSLTHRQVKTDLIRDLLFERGIITSSKTPKEDLAIYFSRIPADYFDFKSIGGKLGRVSRRERITFAEVTGELAPDQIIRAFQAVKGTLEAKGHTVQIESKNDRVVAVISYEHIDYTEVEFRQVQQRDAVIEFVRDGKTSPYFVRNTQNAFADAAVEEVFSALATTTGSKLNRKYISLEGIVDFKARTRFFESLMRGIDKHEFVTVTEAYCYKPRTISIEDESDDDDRKDLEEQPYVERVGLRGKGVNRSFVIDVNRPGI